MFSITMPKIMTFVNDRNLTRGLTPCSPAHTAESVFEINEEQRLTQKRLE